MSSNIRLIDFINEKGFELDAYLSVLFRSSGDKKEIILM
ncbi:hypothetical protein J2S17_000031 [Cytobacillus purgationiresistens]|uniref:Uncharacterized protein n=1 Tax=Cytobacillus purgationiresistens TaxID=863449 RepID=A0ABU0ABJ1_9BACI|nr:hypothetical protein [Cytobacillus purgationiresistens]